MLYYRPDFGARTYKDMHHLDFGLNSIVFAQLMLAADIKRP